MLVSVLIGVYNVEAYVEEAIHSIRLQTHTNLEIIIVDDCSTDRTHEICLNLRSADPRIRVYRNESNKRIAFTLNRALNESKGDFIARMDGDDISEPDRIEKQLTFLEGDKSFDLVGCSVIAIDSKGSEIGRTTHYANFDFLKRTIHLVSPCSHIWMARRNMYEKLGGYREVSGAEDYDFLLRAIDLGFRITNLENYFGYRVRLGRAGNTASTIGARQRLLQKYVFRLHQQRLQFGLDHHSLESMAVATHQTDFSRSLFKFSNNCLNVAIKSTGVKGIPVRFMALMLSLVSPLQAQYLTSRAIYKLMCSTKKK